MADKKKQPGKPKKARSDNTELLVRVEDVLRVRLDGAQFHDLRDFAVEKGWGVSDTQLRRYIQKADDLLVERQEKSRKRLMALSLARREALYARAVNAADYRTALAILSDTDKLRGLYPEKGFRDLVKLAAAQSLRIAELEKRVADANAGATSTAPGATVALVTGVGGEGRAERI